MMPKTTVKMASATVLDDDEFLRRRALLWRWLDESALLFLGEIVEALHDETEGFVDVGGNPR